MPNDITETILEILDKKDDDLAKLYVSAKLSEIMAYLNRENLTEELIPVVIDVIVQSFKSDINLANNVSSYREGDMSVTFSNVSPFYGRLEPFKVISGIKKDV